CTSPFSFPAPLKLSKNLFIAFIIRLSDGEVSKPHMVIDRSTVQKFFAQLYITDILHQLHIGFGMSPIYIALIVEQLYVVQQLITQGNSIILFGYRFLNVFC